MDRRQSTHCDPLPSPFGSHRRGDSRQRDAGCLSWRRGTRLRRRWIRRARARYGGYRWIEEDRHGTASGGVGGEVGGRRLARVACKRRGGRGIQLWAGRGQHRYRGGNRPAVYLTRHLGRGELLLHLEPRSRGPACLTALISSKGGRLIADPEACDALGISDQEQVAESPN